MKNRFWSAGRNIRLEPAMPSFVKEYQIRDNTILYEAFGGRGMICNPYALFLYLLEKEEYQDYTYLGA